MAQPETKLKISSDFFKTFISTGSPNHSVPECSSSHKHYETAAMWGTTYLKNSLYIQIKLQFNNDSRISYSADGLSLAQDKYKQC